MVWPADSRPLLLLLLALALPAAEAETLLTPQHELRIESLCPEGEVSCQRLLMHITPRGGDETVTIGGESLHRPCADGLTPCRFLGYRFTSSCRVYSVLADGRLRITDRAGVLLSEEAGTWQ